MTNTAKNILLIALVVFVGGAVLQPNTATTSDSPVKCQNIMNNSITDGFADNDPLLVNTSDSNPTENRPQAITSCNSFSPVVVATNHLSLKTDEQDCNIRHYNSILSSQTFVFQEPDPPRLS